MGDEDEYAYTYAHEKYEAAGAEHDNKKWRADHEANCSNRRPGDVAAHLATLPSLVARREAEINTAVQSLQQLAQDCSDQLPLCSACNSTCCVEGIAVASQYVTLVSTNFVRTDVRMPKHVMCTNTQCEKRRNLFSPLLVGYFPSSPKEQV